MSRIISPRAASPMSSSSNASPNSALAPRVAMPAAFATSFRTRPISRSRKNRSHSLPLRGRGRPPDRFLAGRLSLLALLRAQRRCLPAERGASARARHRRRMAHGRRGAATLWPGLDTTGVLAATFCAADGIADPNGVTMGFAKAAQALGVEIRRERGSNRSRSETVMTSRRSRRARGRSPPDWSSMPADPGRVRSAGWPGVDVPVDPERRHIFIAQMAPDTTCRPRG